MHPRVSGVKSHADPILYTHTRCTTWLSMRHCAHCCRRHPRSRPCGCVQQQRAEQSSAPYLTCTQTVASKRSASPHMSPWTLQVRRGRCPRQPWRGRIAHWAESPKRDPHRAAPNEAPSSRTERAHSCTGRRHSTTLHGPTRTHACQASSRMPILSSTQHPRCTTLLSMPHCAHAHWCARCDSW